LSSYGQSEGFNGSGIPSEVGLLFTAFER